MTALRLPAFSGCLIDLGSVLLDEQPARERWVALTVTALHSDGRRVSPASLRSALRQSVEERAPDVRARALELVGADGALAARLWDHVDPWGGGLFRPTPDAHAALRRLSARCPLALVSNTEPPARLWLQKNGFEHYFRAILLSCEVGISKPDPRIFRKALNALSCEPEDAVMVGDRLDVDIAPALRLGLWTVRVRRGPSYWQTPQREFERPHLTVPSLHAATLSLGREPAPR